MHRPRRRLLFDEPESVSGSKFVRCRRRVWLVVQVATEMDNFHNRTITFSRNLLELDCLFAGQPNEGNGRNIYIYIWFISEILSDKI